MRRVAFVLAIAMVAVAAQSANAEKPVREDLPVDPFTLSPEVCGFEVLQEAVVDRAKQLTFSDGRQQLSGALTIRLTNLETGNSIVVNASGPAKVTTEGDVLTVHARGPLVTFLLPGEPGGPGLFLYKGKTTYTIDLVSGSLTSITSTDPGPRDLCADMS